MISGTLLHLIRSILLENHIDTTEEFVTECAHDRAVGLAFQELLGEESIKVRGWRAS
jgi:hypothetical protein